MKFAIVFIACLAIATGAIVDVTSILKAKLPATKTLADPIFLQKQKFFLEILNHIHQPLQETGVLKDENVTSYVEGAAFYKNYVPVQEFVDLYSEGLLPKGEIFSIFNEQHLKEAIALFNLFYYSLDWTVLKSNLLWARENTNEGVFIYAVNAVVIHRDDLAGVILPAPYETYPYLFFDSKAINDAQAIKMAAPGVKVPSSAYLIYANYTSNYYLMNDNTKLAYLTEDIDWNSYYYYFHLDYPFWMNGTEFKLNKDRRGEQFLYMHQQLLARYYLERLANRMGEIPDLQWNQPIENGYNPHLRYYNGIAFPVRKNFYDISSTEQYDSLDLVSDYERRIRDIIDFGYYTTRDGLRLDMRQPDSINELGNIIQANPDSVDRRFFGYWLALSHKLLGGASVDYSTSNKIIPSVMEHYETTMRDPVFYQLYKRVVKYFYRFKKNLQPYQTADLTLAGVKINNVTVGKLTTFFEYYNSDITTIVDEVQLPNMTAYISSIGVKKSKKVPKPPKSVSVVARQIRLNHKPFVMSFNITSTGPQRVVFRTYIGPKYDKDGNVMSLNENRDNFVELDQFQYDLPAGVISIVRNSKDFSFTSKDRTSYTELYRKVTLALEGIVPIFLDNSEPHCGFVNRLILPKGWIEGLPMQMFVIISPYVAPEKPQYTTFDVNTSCGIGSGSRFVDNLPFGFPFDREIDEDQFNVPNMYFTDVLIYHKSTTLDTLLYQ